MASASVCGNIGGSSIGRQLGGNLGSSNVHGFNSSLNQQSAADQGVANTAAPQGTRQQRRTATKAAAKAQKKDAQGANKGKPINSNAYGHSVGKPRCSLAKCTDVVSSLDGFCDRCSKSFCNKHAGGGAKARNCQKKTESADGAKQGDAASTSLPSSGLTSSESTSDDAPSSETTIEQAVYSLTLEASQQVQRAPFVPVDFSGNTDENWSD